MHSTSDACTKPDEHNSGACIRILLVGFQELFLAGLRSLIQSEPGMTVVGQAANWTEASEPGTVQADVILFDPGWDDDALAPDVVPSFIAARGASVLIVTGVTSAEFSARAVGLGANGILGKSAPPNYLFNAIRTIRSGQIWIDSSLLHDMRTKAEKKDPEAAKIATLTNREREVITFLCEGLRNKQIAGRLVIAECTVRHHLTTIFEKLGVTDRLELLVYATQRGLASSSRVKARPGNVFLDDKTSSRSRRIARSA